MRKNNRKAISVLLAVIMLVPVISAALPLHSHADDRTRA